MKTLVLGGGLIGMYSAAKLGAHLVTLKQEVQVPYLFLHDDPFNRQMLDDLSVMYDKAIWRIGFVYNGKLLGEATPEMAKIYHLKCYGHESQTPQFKVPYYKILTANYYKVFEKLRSLLGSNVTYGKIISVDTLSKQVELEDGRRLHYDKALNTLPLPDFLRIARWTNGEGFYSKPLFIYTADGAELLNHAFDTVHIIDKDDVRTRYIRGTVTKGTAFLETLEPNSKYGDIVTVIKYGKIVNDRVALRYRNAILEDLLQSDIYCVGRFARFQQHCDTHDALRQLSVYMEALKS